MRKDCRGEDESKLTGIETLEENWAPGNTEANNPQQSAATSETKPSMENIIKDYKL